jgi:ComF family protein
MHLNPACFRQTCKAVWDGTLDVVFPPRCGGCGEWHDGVFCPQCQTVIQPLEAPLCATCGKPFDPVAQPAEVCAECRDNRYHGAPPFTAARSLYLFEGPVRDAIYRFKYRGKTAMAPLLAILLYDYLQQQDAWTSRIPWDAISIIVPVPLHPWRRYRRGYNQSALLARELARRLGCAHGEALRRNRYTSSQIGLSVKARGENVRNAFSLRGEVLQRLNPAGAPVLLIDDVFTTGSTVRECARTLRAAKGNEVYVLTLARQLPRSAVADTRSRSLAK